MSRSVVSPLGHRHLTPEVCSSVDRPGDWSMFNARRRFISCSSCTAHCSKNLALADRTVSVLVILFSMLSSSDGPLTGFPERPLSEETILAIFGPNTSSEPDTNAGFFLLLGRLYPEPPVDDSELVVLESDREVMAVAEVVAVRESSISAAGTITCKDVIFCKTIVRARRTPHPA